MCFLRPIAYGVFQSLRPTVFKASEDLEEDGQMEETAEEDE